MSKHAIGTVVAAMNELYAVLLSWAITISGYSAPADEPKVVMVPHAHLVRSACGGHECKVLGWFPPGETIYLDNRLDPNESMYASSILVHEFVHYLQQESGRLDAKSSCETALAMEREAYAVQREFLTRNGAFYPVGASIHVVGCEPVVRNEMTAASKRPMTEHSSKRFQNNSVHDKESSAAREYGSTAMGGENLRPETYMANE